MRDTQITLAAFFAGYVYIHVVYRVFFIFFFFLCTFGIHNFAFFCSKTLKIYMHVCIKNAFSHSTEQNATTIRYLMLKKVCLLRWCSASATAICVAASPSRRHRHRRSLHHCWGDILIYAN